MKSLMILVAGPYRSGTNDDPEHPKEPTKMFDWLRSVV